MTEKSNDSILNSDYLSFILTASFKCLCLFISEKMTDQCLKLLLWYLNTRIKFFKNISNYSRHSYCLQHILNSKSNTWLISEIYRTEKMRKWEFLRYQVITGRFDIQWGKLFPTFLEMPNKLTSISYELNTIFWKFQFFISLPVMTGSDGRQFQPHCAHLLSEILHPWRFGDYLISFVRKRLDMKKQKLVVSHHWKWLF